MKNILLLIFVMLLCSCSATRHPALAFNPNAAHGKVYQQKVHRAPAHKEQFNRCPKRHIKLPNFKIIL